MNSIKKIVEQKKNFVHVTLLLLIILPVISLGQIRESANYKIERDSLNVGGGLSESSNFGVTDSIGQAISGRSESSNYEIAVAGFQQQPQVADTYIAVTSPIDVTLSAISGFTGGTSTSTISWNVETNNSSGYELSILSSTNPTMQTVSGDVIANYTPVGANPDLIWNVPSTEAAFGYSVSGANIVDFFKDDGFACNTGGGTGTDSCWYGFSTSSRIIASTNSQNAPTGATTTVELQAEIGNEIFIDAGDYSASLTVTAVTL